MKDDHQTWANLALQSGVSAELRGLFAGLREVRLSGGDRRRYPKWAVDELARALVCRDYQHQTLELAHFLFAANYLHPAGFIGLLYQEEMVTPARFKDAVAQPVTARDLSLSLDDRTLVLTYGDGSWRINLSRVPMIAATLEFLLTVMPYDALTTALSLTPSKRAAGALASRFQKEIYAHLADHLEPAQVQRKARVLINWLADGDRLSPDGLDDAAILAFWSDQASADAASGDFRTFSACAETAFHLSEALRTGQLMHEAQYADDLTNQSDGKADAHAECLAEIDLADLSQPPLDRFKLVNKADTALINDPVMRPMLAARFTLTWIRLAVFGFAQNKISQAKRRREPIAPLITAPPPLNYDDIVTALTEVEQRLSTLRLACLHGAMQSDAVTGLTLLTDHLPADQLEMLSDYLSAHDSGAIDRFARDLPKLRLKHPALNQLLRRAESHYDKTNRRGFDGSVRDADLFEQAHQFLGQILIALQRHQQNLTRCLASSGDSSSLFASDLSIFQDGFGHLYGDPA